MSKQSYFDLFDLREVNNLELLAKQVVEGFIIGLHKSPFHGFSVEFAEHRIYNPGSSTKNIDWKVFARTDKLFTKRFEEETNLRCQLVLDVSSSMNFPAVAYKTKSSVNKLRWSALAAASLMNLLKKQRDAFGLTTFDEAVKVHTKCKSSTKHYRLLLSYLDQAIHNEAAYKETNCADALHQIAESIHKRSLVVIFSDMFEAGKDNDAMFSALQHLKYNKHEVILFHVVDKSKEIEFEFVDRPHLFVDLETNEKIKLQPKQVKALYQKQIGAFKDKLKLKCLQYRIDFIEVDIQNDFKQVLQAYLIKRSKMNT